MAWIPNRARHPFPRLHRHPSQPCSTSECCAVHGRVYHHINLHTLVWMKHHRQAVCAKKQLQTSKDAASAAEASLSVVCRLHERGLETQHGMAAMLAQEAAVDEALMNLREREGQLGKAERRASRLPRACQGLQRLLLYAMALVRKTYPSSILSGM